MTRWTLRHLRRAAARQTVALEAVVWDGARAWTPCARIRSGWGVRIGAEPPPSVAAIYGADAHRELDRLISLLGPDWPEVEARPKGTDEVIPDATPGADSVHGGDGASGEVSPQTGDGGEDSASASPTSAAADGSGGTGTAPGSPDGGGSAGVGAGDRSPGGTSSSTAAGGAEPGQHPGDVTAPGTPGTGTGSSGGDHPRESAAVPSPPDAPGDLGSQNRDSDGEGGDVTSPHPAGTARPGSSPVAQLVAAVCDQAACLSSARERRWVRRHIRALLRPDVAVRPSRDLLRRCTWAPRDLREAIGEALDVSYRLTKGGGPASGRDGGSGSYVDHEEARAIARTLSRSRTSRRLRRALERWLDRDVGTHGDPTPRLDGARLVREISGRSMRLARALREEHEPSTGILAVDVSGSCSVYCHRTMAAALTLARTDDRLIVVQHVNGQPTHVYRSGRWTPTPPPADLVAWWLDQARRARTRSVWWLGDADGHRIRSALENAGIRVQLGDNYSASHGPPRCAPARVAEPHLAAHVVGVGDAASLLAAMRLAD